MKNFIDYIEDSCRGLGGSQSAYRYKKMLLDQMNQRADAVAKAGLKDENVMRDLIKDEYADPEKGFKGWEKRNRKVKFMKKGMPIGALVSLLLIFIAYFSVSAMTSAWGKTWLIIVGGIFAMIIFGLSVAASEICRMRRIFHPIARLLIVGNTVLVAVFIFLFLLMMIPEMTVWPILPAGVILALIADLIFAFATKQKLRTVCVFIYMPVIATMMYVILAAYSVISWSAGWPVILLGPVADVVYISFIIMGNIKYFTYKQEADE